MDIYGYLRISMDIYGSIAISWAIDIISRGMNIHKSHLFSCEPLGLQGFDMFWPIPISGLYIPTSKLGSGILESRPRPTPHLGEGCLSARHNHGHENDDQSCHDASQRWGAKHRDPEGNMLVPAYHPFPASFQMIALENCWVMISRTGAPASALLINTWDLTAWT